MSNTTNNNHRRSYTQQMTSNTPLMSQLIRAAFFPEEADLRLAPRVEKRAEEARLRAMYREAWEHVLAAQEACRAVSERWWPEFGLERLMGIPIPVPVMRAHHGRLERARVAQMPPSDTLPGPEYPVSRRALQLPLTAPPRPLLARPNWLGERTSSADTTPRAWAVQPVRSPAAPVARPIPRAAPPRPLADVPRPSVAAPRPLPAAAQPSPPVSRPTAVAPGHSGPRAALREPGVIAVVSRPVLIREYPDRMGVDTRARDLPRALYPRALVGPRMMSRPAGPPAQPPAPRATARPTASPARLPAPVPAPAETPVVASAAVALRVESSDPSRPPRGGSGSTIPVAPLPSNGSSAAPPVGPPEASRAPLRVVRLGTRAVEAAPLPSISRGETEPASPPSTDSPLAPAR